MLLQKTLGQRDSNEEVTELAAALEFRAACYGPRDSIYLAATTRWFVQQYLQDFQRSDRKRTSVLDYKGGQLYQDRKAKISIIITWQISFNDIHQMLPVLPVSPGIGRMRPWWVYAKVYIKISAVTRLMKSRSQS